MDKELIKLIEKIGVDGIEAIYVYLFLDYASVWLTIGMCTWGVRTMWKHYIKGGFKDL